MTAAHPEVYKPGDHYQIEVTRMHDQINARANTILMDIVCGLGTAVCDCEFECRQPGAGADGAARIGTGSAPGAGREHPRRSGGRCWRRGWCLCGSGAIAAILLAIPMVSVLGRYAARFSVRANDLTLDFSLVWFGIVLALVAASLSCVCSRSALAEWCAGRAFGARGAAGGGSSRRLRIFAVTQITASFLLLAGACVLMKTLFVLEQTRPPFDSANVTGGELAGVVVWEDAGAGKRVLSRSAAPGRCVAGRGACVFGF